MTAALPGYTVIDLETTGLWPEKHDRIVEIAVVYVSPSGEIQDRWSTLVNPGRDVGPTRIHGISATDVARAPTFADLAPYVLRAVAGRIVVAHNSSFDLRFLDREFARAGVTFTTLPMPSLCTMRWAAAFLDTSSRRLIDCCRECGIDLTNAHSAAADAMATAQLFSYFVMRSGADVPWADAASAARLFTWPTYVGAYRELEMVHRERVHAARKDSWLDAIVARMPRAADTRVDAYLEVLEMAMLDGFLAEAEKDHLIATALADGLTRGEVLNLHGEYLRALAEVALQHGVVTTAERSQLEEVSALLGLCTDDIDKALVDAGRPERRGRTAVDRLGVHAIELSPRDRIVFTGAMKRERSEWEAVARAHGLQTGGVTKQTRLVVAADPNSLSGKAAKARAYGVPIVTEDAFERLIADMPAALV